MESISDGRIGDYQIRQRIANGGMATIFLASHPRFGERVALKVLSPRATENREFVARFEREAQVIASLDHPYIVKVYEAGCVAGRHYIAMEYLPYGSLKNRLERFKTSDEHMPVAEALEVAWQIASALDHAHQRGLIHRDVKPSNILLAAGGRCVLTDFGVVFAPSSPRLTRDLSQAVGTVEYMSPEQAAQHPYDHRVDIYALGIVLYEMLTGDVPFAGDIDMAVMLAHAHRAPASITAYRSDVSPTVTHLVETAMAKDPNQRFQTAGQLALAIEHVPAQTQDTTSPPSVLARPVTFRPAVVMVITLVVVVVLGICAVSAASPSHTPARAAGTRHVQLSTLTLVISHEAVASTVPGQGNPIGTRLRPGTQLTILGRTADQRWWLVSLPANHHTGWIAASDAVLSGSHDAVPQVPIPSRSSGKRGGAASSTDK